MLEFVCDDYETEIVRNFDGEDVEVYKVRNNILDQNDLNPESQEAYLVGSIMRESLWSVSEEDYDSVENDPKYRKIIQSMFPIVVGRFPSPDTVPANAHGDSFGASQHIINTWSCLLYTSPSPRD